MSRRLRQGAEPKSELLERVPAPRGRAGGGVCRGGEEPALFFGRLVALGSAEAWGGQAAGRPQRGGREEPAAAALGRKTRRRGRRTRGVTSQGSPHWNLIFIYPGFTLLPFFS